LTLKEVSNLKTGDLLRAISLPWTMVEEINPDAVIVLIVQQKLFSLPPVRRGECRMMIPIHSPLWERINRCA
jgi:hypothetical protein